MKVIPPRREATAWWFRSSNPRELSTAREFWLWHTLRGAVRRVWARDGCGFCDHVRRAILMFSGCCCRTWRMRR